MPLPVDPSMAYRLLGFVVFVLASTRILQAQTLVPIENPEPESAGHFGWSVAPLSDIDGDGATDFLIGAPGRSVDGTDSAGRAFVISGATRLPLLTLSSPGASSNGQFGWDVTGLPDATGDGLPELLIGAPFERYGTVPRAGNVYVFSGTGDFLFPTIGLPQVDANHGYALVAIPDGAIEGWDFLIGTPGYSFTPPGRSGAFTIHDGMNGAITRAFETGGVPSELGTSVAATDADLDGLIDSCVGSPGISNGRGRAECVFRDTAASPRQKFYFAPLDAERFGRTLSAISDRNGDGANDLFFGSLGEAFVYSAVSGDRLLELRPENGEQMDFGRSLDEAGDLDGDGDDDLLVGAPNAEVEGTAGAGVVLVVRFSDGSQVLRLESLSPEADGQFGWDVKRTDDLDGDGQADFLVGAPGEAEGGGRAYLVLTNGVSTSLLSAPEPSLALSIAPNPVAHTLRLSANSGGPAVLEAYDSLGRRVWEAETLGSEIRRVDVTTWEAGVYIVRLRSNSGTVTKRFVVTR
ncbi:MAG: T9SS type A sorting domain-containing protein [Bacteroidota bacterium]